MDPEQALAAADAEVDALDAAAAAHHDALDALARNREVTEEYRSRQRATMNRAFSDTLVAHHHRTNDLLAQAAADAEQVMSATAPTDVTAPARVQAALASMSAPEVAAVLGEVGDVDGLRALRRLAPLHVAAITSDPNHRQQFTADLRSTVDAQLAALGTPAEAAAVRARAALDGVRQRLETVENFSRNPSPGRRLALGYSAR